MDLCAYNQLLDSTIEYLRGLKQQGVRYITISSGTSERGQAVRANEEMVTRGQAVRAPMAGKAEAMAALREQALACVKCAHLVKARKNVVFGVGNIDAELMFVGEAPGADEDARGTVRGCGGTIVDEDHSGDGIEPAEGVYS